MYENILEATPWFIRKMVQKNMNNAIVELCEDAVTETDMYAIIMKITPKANLQDSLDVLDKHKTRAVQHSVTSTASTAVPSAGSFVIAEQDVCFEQNSKLMYENILEATPWFIRKMVQKNMNNAIADLCQEAVTETHMYAIITQITPKSNLQDSIDVLDKLKTRAVQQSVTNTAFTTVTVVSTSEDVLFEQNSKLMYDNVLEATPGFIRKVVQKNMNNAIADLCEEAVTENDMYEVVKQITPKHFLQNSIDVLDQHKTHAVKQFEEEYRTSSFIVAGKEVRFEQSSKVMYDKILEGHPVFVRQVVKNNLDKAISEMCGEIMTENDMYEVINVASPKPLLKFNIIILDEHKTS